jgi:TetR/AcrR family transcriptional regulator, mexCD-oprJ operon repressor
MASVTESGSRRRADAQRNIAAILAAATGLLARDPEASMVDIARAAGVGRVTLYAHFPSRNELVRAALTEAIAQSTAAIVAAAPDQGPPVEAFARLIHTCWPMLAQFGGLHQAAQQALPAEEMRRRHDLPMVQVERVITRGRKTGDFRTDLPVEWLVTTAYALLHAASDEVHAGRLAVEDAGHLLEETLLSMLMTSK